MRKKRNVSFFIELAHISSLGFSIPLALVIGLFFGQYLDNSVFGTSPWFTIIFTVMGFGAGFRNIALVFRMARKMHDKY